MARFLVVLLICLAGCRSRPEGPPAIAKAYVGAITLNIRQDLPLKSPVVATLKHGDPVDILQTRRRFMMVRTENGVVGWVDSRQLISTAQMDDLRRLGESAAKLPSMGRATVFEPLNVHSEPVRTSPSFAQIAEGGSVEVIGHKVMPRNARPSEAAPLVPPKSPAPKRDRGRDRKKGKESRIPPPPPPPAPPVPANWQELSKTPPSIVEEAKEPEKPVPIDDWSYVRTKDGKAGWVLSRMLTMAIPDEVAQYAEGHRITSYFPMADVQDEGQTRHYWLWTTLSSSGVPYEFDSFRFFIWSLRHHRYETAYIERRVVGYYPVTAQKGTGQNGAGATFWLILDQDGQLVRNTYAFNGYRVNLTNKEPYTPGGENGETRTAAGSAPRTQNSAKTAGIWDRIKRLFSRK